MRKLLLTAGTALCVFGTPAFATTGAFQAQGPLAGMALAIQSEMTGAVLVPGPHRAAILLAQKGGPTVPPGNSGSNGNDQGQDNLAKCETATPSHPCKGNNGFGNGGNDGSPNNFPNPTNR